MVADGYEELRRAFTSERPTWQAVAEAVEARLIGIMRRAHVPCTVKSRAKGVHNLVRTGIRKHKTELADFGDRAGARVVVAYPVDVPRACEAVSQAGFWVSVRRDDKEPYTAGEEPDRFGYRGIHFDAIFPHEELDDAKGALPTVAGGDLKCEVQVHTPGQALWADSTHDIAYKPGTGVPDAAKRTIYQLSALLEIYDDVFGRSIETIMGEDRYDASILLSELEGQFFSVIGIDYDRELSIELLEVLLPLYESNEAAIEAVNGFDSLADLVSWTVEKYQHNPPFLLHQPESLIILDRLAHGATGLLAVWDEAGLPESWLTDLARVYRQPLPSRT